MSIDSRDSLKLTRQQLYDQVWSTPMRTLAQQYGLSDVGLAKVCKKHDIPRPPVGYWAKLQHGKPVEQPPLPDSSSDGAIEISNPGDRQASESAEADSTVQQLAAEEKKKDAKIEIADSLRGAHKLVSQANQDFQGVKAGETGLVDPGDGAVLDIHVAKASQHRALRIMDALLKALEDRGYSVSPGPTVRLLDADVRFGIVEQLDTKEEEPDEHDLDGHYTFGHSRFNRKKVASGRFELRLHDEESYWRLHCRKAWRDTKTKRLENELNKFVSGLMTFAAKSREREEEHRLREEKRLEEERRRQEEAQRRAELCERYKAEKARVDRLMQEANNWRKSQDLRDFIDAMKRRHLERHGTIDADTDFARWLEWAYEQADRLDPLTSSPPSILDEDVGDLEDEHHRFGRRW